VKYFKSLKITHHLVVCGSIWFSVLCFSQYFHCFFLFTVHWTVTVTVQYQVWKYAYVSLVY